MMKERDGAQGPTEEVTEQGKVVELAEKRRERRRQIMERIYEFEEEIFRAQLRASPRISREEETQLLERPDPNHDWIKANRAMEPFIELTHNMADYMRELAGISLEEYVAYCRERED